MSNRRAFLKFLAGTPLLAAAPSLAHALVQSSNPQTIDSVIASAAEAINVFDFEAAARNAGHGTVRRAFAQRDDARFKHRYGTEGMNIPSLSV